MKYDIFISHSSKDEAWVHKLADALRTKGFRVFDETEIKPGEFLAEKLEEALRESEFYVPVISTEEINSNLAFELGAALGFKRLLIPVVADDVPLEAIPGPIKRRQYVHKGDPVDVAEQIAQGISEEKNGGKKKQAA